MLDSETVGGDKLTGFPCFYSSFFFQRCNVLRAEFVLAYVGAAQPLVWLVKDFIFQGKTIGWYQPLNCYISNSCCQNLAA